MRSSRGHCWVQSSNHVTVKQSSTRRAEGQCLSSLVLVPSDAGPCPATLKQSGGVPGSSQPAGAASPQPETKLLWHQETVINASLHPAGDTTLEEDKDEEV